MEILAPAGNYESLKAAINCGASAVYFGTNNFNARKAAQNFQVEDLEAVCHLCHINNVRCYLTLNTIVQDEDFAQIYKVLKAGCDAGIDAVIVQDFGIARFIRTHFKNLEMHASTQMGVHNLFGAKVCEQMGFKRVVLSRETSLNDIKEISQNTKLEIEFFVHGALCVSFSGACYLSHILFNKSGNCGQCKQPCRMPVESKVLESENLHLLSAKDISLFSKLTALKNAGVCSLKIEGRLRRAGYVAQSVLALKSALNNKEFDRQGLKQAFSRGDFNENAYLNGSENIINNLYPAHFGTVIGSVVRTKKLSEINIVSIKSAHKFTKGDVLKFFSGNKEIGSLCVFEPKQNKQGETEIFTKTYVPAGAQVNLILNAAKENAALLTLKQNKINVQIYAFSGEPLRACLMSQGISVECVGKVCESAKNAPLNEKDFKKNFEKTGEENFILGNFKLSTNGVFIAVSMLNEFRRNAFEKLYCALCKRFEKKVKVLPFSFKQEEDYSSEIENYVTAPAFLRSEDLKEFQSKLSKNSIIAAANIGHLFFSKLGFKVAAGPQLNACNTLAKAELTQLGAFCVCAGAECQNKNWAALKNFKLPVATFAHCPFKERFNTPCIKCRYVQNTKLKIAGQEFILKRTKLKNCVFEIFKVE